MDNGRKHAALGRRVLVVEDDQSVRELLLELLTDEGHVVRAAADATQALIAARELRPQAILLDLRLGRTDGHHFVDAYRAEFPDDAAALVVMSGLTGLHAFPGADAVLSKPFTLEEVVRAVETSPLGGNDKAATTPDAPRA